MNDPLDLNSANAALRAGLAQVKGPQYWRSLEELSQSEAFQRLLAHESAVQASQWPPDLSRRKFLALMGASLALAGLNGCSVRPAPSKEIVPYVRAPEELVPGQPLFYATSMTLDGASVGLLVESHLGRPTKIEGNPEHPASLGATDAFAQASVLTLYDPDRSKNVLDRGQPSTWEDASRALGKAMTDQRKSRGRGLRLLTETIVSPTLGAQIKSLLHDFPEATWHQYEPLHRDAPFQASQLAFGKPVDAVYDFSQADVVVSLDADFLTSGPGKLRYARDFMARRRVRTSAPSAKTAEMNRLYIAETAVSCTGAKADHRLAIRPADVERLARAIAAHAGILDQQDDELPSEWQKWAAAVANDLAAHRGRSLVLAGDQQPTAVHLLAHALNDHLGNAGKTVVYTEAVAVWPVDQTDSLKALVDDMERGRVELLIMLGGNPVYAAPADFEFARHLERVPLRAHLSLFRDETSRLCHWHLPEAHYLEAWSDGRAFDGTASLAQPLIEPLYQGRSAHEVLAMLAGGNLVPGRDLVRDHWRQYWQAENKTKSADTENDFETFWQTALHDGVIPGTKQSAIDLHLSNDWRRGLPGAVKPAASASSSSNAALDIVFRADPAIHDGRFANNGWLQELPKPLTKLAWGNAAIMSPRTAQAHGLSMGSYAHGGEHGGYYMPVIEVQLGDRRIKAPLWIMPGHADGAVTVYLGHGRNAAGAVGGDDGHRVGFNAYPLRTSQTPWYAAGLQIVKTADEELVACTQQHHWMENRDLVRSASLAEYRATPDFAARQEKHVEHDQRPRDYRPLTLYEPFDYSPPKHKWGMSIDLTSCIGCNACMIACQAENNIPVVGKEQVAAGREMHWIRIDRYAEGSADSPHAFHFQPVPCMHCENAPCEYVCPVEATVHSAEGLNEMIYNRCVGTRFCSNNCPYKVRRFNFFAYADFESETRRMQYNPDVTVRSRGVMEKCTYCVQRLRHAEITSQVENRPIADGEVLTACQAACPTQAIIFGDMNDPQSQVKQWKDSPLHYGLLADQNTLPRTTYLAELRNPNPELEAS
jgi:MoCo/4Fe-4S cofactor protein with predicted Tat translocation signal